MSPQWRKLDRPHLDPVSYRPSSPALWLGALPRGNPLHSARAPASAASSPHLGCSDPLPTTAGACRAGPYIVAVEMDMGDGGFLKV